MSKIFLPLVVAVSFSVLPCWADFAEHYQDGKAALESGKYARAETELLKAQKEAASSGQRYDKYATCLLTLAQLYSQTNRSAEAEKAYKEVSVIYEKSFGVNCKELGVTQDALGDLYKHNHKYKEGITAYAIAVGIREKLLPEHSDYADSLMGLGDCYRKLDMNDKAAPVLTKALAIRRKVYSISHPKVAKSMDSLCSAYIALGKYDMAAPILEQLVSSREVDRGAKDPKVASALEQQALCLGQLGKEKKAEKAYQKALTVRQANAADTKELADCLQAYAKFKRKIGQADEAAKLEAQAKQALAPKAAKPAPGAKPAAKAK
jgi:tetratricopeptide (TPR) repeat protein